MVLLTSVSLALSMHGGYRNGIQMNGVAYFCESGPNHGGYRNGIQMKDVIPYGDCGCFVCTVHATMSRSYLHYSLCLR